MMRFCKSLMSIRMTTFCRICDKRLHNPESRRDGPARLISHQKSRPRFEIPQETGKTPLRLLWLADKFEVTADRQI
jgi:hypothetical protein